MSGVTNPPSTTLIDVEYVELPAAVPDRPRSDAGALITRGVTAPVDVVINRQEALRAKDRERKRVARARERELRVLAERRSHGRRRTLKRFAGAAVVLAAATGAVLVTGPGSSLATRLDSLIVEQVGTSTAVAGLAQRIEALPDPAARLDTLSGITAELGQRIGQPAQAAQVAGVLAATSSVGAQLDRLNLQMAALAQKVSAPIQLTPPSPAAEPVKPPLDCEPAPPDKWWARQGESLEAVLRRWLSSACWRLVWKIPGSYEWEVDVSLPGDLDVRAAVREALLAFRGAPLRPVGDSWPEQRTLVVVPATDDTGG